MARKTGKRNIHDFTDQIHSSRRAGTEFADMPNHNERMVADADGMACHHCRFFRNGCSDYIGRWHKICSDFEWW